MLARNWRTGLGLCVAGMLGLSRTALADSPPKVDTAQPTPVVYPETAQRAGEQGTVVVNVYVNSRGKPMGVNVARSSGYEDLDNAAMETAMNWHYLPAIRNGDTAPDWALVQVVYKLPEPSRR